jgi:hypothetical protein
MITFQQLRAQLIRMAVGLALAIAAMPALAADTPLQHCLPPAPKIAAVVASGGFCIGKREVLSVTDRPCFASGTRGSVSETYKNFGCQLGLVAGNSFA